MDHNGASPIVPHDPPGHTGREMARAQEILGVDHVWLGFVDSGLPEGDPLPALPDDEFYHADLIGLEVADPGGAILGRVRAIYDHGAGDILEISGPSGLILIPFTRAAVPTVDLAARRIVADPPGSDE